MSTEETKALVAIPAVILIGYGFAVAGSGSVSEALQPHPFAVAVVVAFLIQWIAFAPAFARQTERYFDLVGGVTYISCAVLAFAMSETRDLRSWLLLALVLIWATRLATFLFLRIHKTGKDDRFDSMKPSFLRFGAAWTLQGLWVVFTAAAALAAITSEEADPNLTFTVLGCLVWLAGFTIEAVADAQKRRFKANPENEGRFIDCGLWARSRHPNYFGEIVLWTGVAIIAFPALEGLKYLTLLSPVFVLILLTRVSGVPLLEEKADKKWGGQSGYEAYKRSTPVLVPKLSAGD